MLGQCRPFQLLHSRVRRVRGVTADDFASVYASLWLALSATQYCCCFFGPALLPQNVASRMESTSEPNKVGSCHSRVLVHTQKCALTRCKHRLGKVGVGWHRGELLCMPVFSYAKRFADLVAVLP